MAFLELI